jgi:hypothetical protein
MSVSHCSYVVVGVPFKDVYETKKTKKLVTKYNVDTGKPYQMPIDDWHFFWAGKEITEECDYQEDFVKKMCGLDIISSNDEGSVIGLEIAQAESNKVIEIEPKIIQEAILSVSEKLKASGYHGDVKVYLVSWAG